MEVLTSVGVSNAGVRSSVTGLNSGFRSPRPPTHLAPYRQALDFAIKPVTLHQATFRRPLCITADLKRWERKEVKENSLPVTQTLHVKVGDTVQVISGAEKKKVGEVLRIFTHDSRILVKNVNFKTKHIKGRSKEESGQIIQVEAPIHSSNVMLYSKEKKVASRVGHKVLEDGRKVRYLIKTGETIDNKDDWKKIHKKDKKEDKK